jgi:parallel beta helix pectate lyase-like protein
MHGSRLFWILAALTIAMAVLTTSAYGHVERTSYWPDPAPDTTVKPAAGGKVPRARTLGSALKGGPRDTRVVCKRGSLRRAIRSINSARRKGWVLRPSQGKKKLSARNARRLKRQNRAFAARCGYISIQAAIRRSRNNDRVIVMPGRYVEPRSRAKPTDDPKCAQYKEESDDGAGAATFRYQVTCPNDQNLIYLQGRALVETPPPNPPREDRHGIPDNGRCIRCNVQIDGTGAKPEDTVVDLAKDTHAKLRGPSEALKEVGIRADRADGLVIRNMSFAHAAEHGVYIHETDGYLMQRVKFFWNQEYGGLMFTSDHGLTADCEGMGSGDSAIYPGGAPDTGEQTAEAGARVNQTITRCDIHHNTLGYSGTMGNGTRVVGNHFYDNGTGITTDSFYAGGHPGYPQDSARFERNQIYSNNFNTFAPGSDVDPRVPVPVGVGIFIAGGNNNNVAGNRIYDNWRRGVMLIQVPDSISDEKKLSADSTSHRNRFHNNVMGIAPDGRKMPNGVDFWWDEAAAQHNDCWYDNGAVTTDPPGPLTPTSCSNTSVGVTYPAKLSTELGPCAGAITAGGYDPSLCPWFRSPEKPSAERGSGGMPILPAHASGAPKLTLFSDMCRVVGNTVSCDGLLDRP